MHRKSSDYPDWFRIVKDYGFQNGPTIPFVLGAATFRPLNEPPIDRPTGQRALHTLLMEMKETTLSGGWGVAIQWCPTTGAFVVVTRHGQPFEWDPALEAGSVDVLAAKLWEKHGDDISAGRYSRNTTTHTWERFSDKELARIRQLIGTLCIDCVNEPVLKQWMEDKSVEGVCWFCKKHSKVVLFPLIAMRIDEVIREYYVPAADKPHVVEWSDNIKYWTEGTPAVEIIGDIAELESEIAVAIDDLLSEEEQWEVHREGETAYYGGVELEPTRAHAGEFLEAWVAFEQRLMHKVRFFDDVGKAMLDSLLGDVTSLAGGKAVFEIEPMSELSTLYRARVIEDEGLAEEFAKNPSIHLGPPPPTKARAGRMNPFGIPAFYGAFSAEVALAEVRPSVGSLVAVAEFRVTKRLRLLDLSFLPFVFHDESIFSAEYGSKRNKVRFLRELHKRISRPVLPNDEALKYLPTQAVTAYVTNVLKLDGIIYESQQLVSDRDESGQAKKRFCNIALFDDAAKVEHLAQSDMDWFANRWLAKTQPGGAVVPIGQPDEAVRKPFALKPEKTGLARVRAVEIKTDTVTLYRYEDGEVLIVEQEDFGDDDD